MVCFVIWCNISLKVSIKGCFSKYCHQRLEDTIIETTKDYSKLLKRLLRTIRDFQRLLETIRKYIEDFQRLFEAIRNNLRLFKTIRDY